MGFEQARSIGILYDASEMQSYDIVKNYVKDIRARHKEVLALGFVDKKDLPQMQFAKLGLDFFTRRDLNWYMVPKGSVVTNFINTEFDILINLCSGRNFPLQYISALSKAKFRIGTFTEGNTSFYDLLIDLKGDKNLKHMIHQVDHYMNIIRANED